MERSSPESMCWKKTTSPTGCPRRQARGNVASGAAHQSDRPRCAGPQNHRRPGPGAEAAVPGLKLKLLFSPEHGINGALDKEGIQNSKDAVHRPARGQPLWRLIHRRPSLETLRSLDAVLIDLQDAGVRFYTYETVVRYFLEAAGQTGTDIVVLDRPDPLGGAFVQGPVSDTGRESYVNVAPIPVRHGMTLGELARYLNGEYKLGAAAERGRNEGLAAGRLVRCHWPHLDQSFSQSPQFAARRSFIPRWASSRRQNFRRPRNRHSF